MANEISASANLSVTLGGSTVSSTCNKILDIAGNEVLTHIDSIGTSDAALPLSSLDNVGFLLVKNLDTTNFVQISTGTGGSFAAGVIGKIRPGLCWMGEPPSSTLYIKADTAACRYEATAVEL